MMHQNVNMQTLLHLYYSWNTIVIVSAIEKEHLIKLFGFCNNDSFLDQDGGVNILKISIDFKDIRQLIVGMQ